MKSSWQANNLGDILKLEYGKPLQKHDRKINGKYPVYGANGVKDYSDKFYFDKPSIIIGRKGSAGEVNLTTKRFWPLDVTYFVTFDDNKYDLIFLYNLLTFLELPKLAKGVKPGINRNEVYSIRARIPSLPEQRRIVNILSQAFVKIENAKENTENNLQNARELFESYLNQIFENPKTDWSYCLLNDFVRFIDYRGRTPKKTTSGIRLITAKNIKLGYLQKEPEEFIDPSGYDGWMTRGVPLKGDVLFTTEAPLANVAQLDTDEKVAFAQRVIILQPEKNKLTQSFLKYILLSRPIRGQIIKQETGATVKGIKSRLLKKIPIYFPSLTKQQTIVEKLDSLSKETKILESIYKKKLAYLEELKKSILQKAFAGEL